MASTLHRGWHNELASLVEAAESRLVIVAPFISQDGAAFLTQRIKPLLRSTGRIEILTDLSPAHVSDGSLQPQAVINLFKSTTQAILWHVPRLHAKVYIADDRRAIVTSGNLTAAAFYRNAEYGAKFDDRESVTTIQSHFDDFRAAGTTVALDDLLKYAGVAEQVRSTTVRQQNAVDPRLKQALQSALSEAEDQLIRLRLAGGAVHTVFAKTIQYLLAKYGPMQTPQLHHYIQLLHPDLCDDAVDRVINGEHFGKKWKHAVRTAQQQLKRVGIAEYVEPVWRLTSTRSTSQ